MSKIIFELRTSNKRSLCSHLCEWMLMAAWNLPVIFQAGARPTSTPTSTLSLEPVPFVTSTSTPSNTPTVSPYAVPTGLPSGTHTETPSARPTAIPCIHPRHTNAALLCTSNAIFFHTFVQTHLVTFSILY